MLKPLSNRVVLQLAKKEEEKSAGGLLLTTSVKEQDNVATVVAVANDITEINVGDKVVFDTFSTTKVTQNNEDFFIIKAENILAIIA